MPRWTFENKITMGNVVQIVILVGGFLWAYASLSNTVASSAEAVKILPELGQRVSTLETRINLGQAAREAYQLETKQTLRELDERSIEILKAIARLEARE